MFRPLRIEYPNAFYHVMNRGAGRQSVYLVDDDYGMFLEAVKELSKFFDIRVICYCLMPNHYHLLIQTPPRADILGNPCMLKMRGFVSKNGQKRDPACQSRASTAR